MNAIKRARRSAGITQEKAAEMAGCSVDSIQAWENGSRRCPDDMLNLLGVCYKADWLYMVYIMEQAKGPSADAFPTFEPGKPLPKAVLELLDAVNTFFDRHGDRRLVSIAADGIVSEAERPEFDSIMEDIEGINRAYMAVKYAKNEGGTES